MKQLLGQVLPCGLVYVGALGRSKWLSLSTPNCFLEDPFDLSSVGPKSGMLTSKAPTTGKVADTRHGGRWYPTGLQAPRQP